MMTLTVEFCEARAKEAADEATCASLDNVRERALRSQAAWQAMADRATEVAKARVIRELDAQQARDRREHEDAHSESGHGPQ
jgi:hypothetical protein